MSSGTVLSLLRSILTAVGSFFIGKNVFGHPLDDVTLMGWVGVLVTLGSVVWGFVDKTSTIESFQSALRSVGVTVGGILVGIGKATQENIDTWLAAIAGIAPIIYGILSRQKTAAIVDGKIDVKTLAGGSATPKQP